MNYLDKERVINEAIGCVVRDPELRAGLQTAFDNNDIKEVRRLLKNAGFELTPSEAKRLGDRSTMREIVRFLSVLDREYHDVGLPTIIW